MQFYPSEAFIIGSFLMYGISLFTWGYLFLWGNIHSDSLSNSTIGVINSLLTMTKIIFFVFTLVSTFLGLYSSFIPITD